MRFFTAYTGAGAPRFYLSLNPELPNPGYAQFVVMTKDLEARERVRSRLMASVDEQFPRPGCASRASSSVRRSGSRAVPRRRPRHAEGARDRARGRAGRGREARVRDVQLDWNDPVRTLKVDVDQDKARALGLTPADVTLMTQTVMNGATLSQLREGEDLVDIVARAVPRSASTIDTLKDEPLHPPGHGRAAVAGRARRYELEEPVLWRRNRDMAITVRADVKDGEQGVSATQSIRPT